MPHFETNLPKITGSCKKDEIEHADINDLKTKHPKIIHRKFPCSDLPFTNKKLYHRICWPFLNLRSFSNFEDIEFSHEITDDDWQESENEDHSEKWPKYEFYCDGEKCEFSFEADGRTECPTEISKQLEVLLQKLKIKKVAMKVSKKSTSKPKSRNGKSTGKAKKGPMTCLDLELAREDTMVNAKDYECENDGSSESELNF